MLLDGIYPLHPARKCSLPRTESNAGRILLPAHGSWNTLVEGVALETAAVHSPAGTGTYPLDPRTVGGVVPRLRVFRWAAVSRCILMPQDLYCG
uniref:DUF397 domain-containing protein n=1 Tax=Knipowitschia caucasica TaxID=637954 RepID=A0AAV2J3C6_KNICA